MKEFKVSNSEKMKLIGCTLFFVVVFIILLLDRAELFLLVLSGLMVLVSAFAVVHLYNLKYIVTEKEIIKQELWAKEVVKWENINDLKIITENSDNNLDILLGTVNDKQIIIESSLENYEDLKAIIKEKTSIKQYKKGILNRPRVKIKVALIFITLLILVKFLLKTSFIFEAALIGIITGATYELVDLAIIKQMIKKAELAWKDKIMFIINFMTVLIIVLPMNIFGLFNNAEKFMNYFLGIFVGQLIIFFVVEKLSPLNLQKENRFL